MLQQYRQCYIPGHTLVINYSFKHATYVLLHFVYYKYYKGVRRFLSYKYIYVV